MGRKYDRFVGVIPASRASSGLVRARCVSLVCLSIDHSRSNQARARAVRQQLIATSEIPKLNALRGKDGKYRRVTRITTNTAKEAERAQQALQILGNDAPRKDLELRLAQRRAKRKKKEALTRGRQVEPPGKGGIKIYHCPFQRLEEPRPR
jgi:hypothetical protein